MAKTRSPRSSPRPRKRHRSRSPGTREQQRQTPERLRDDSPAERYFIRVLSRVTQFITVLAARGRTARQDPAPTVVGGFCRHLVLVAARVRGAVRAASIDLGPGLVLQRLAAGVLLRE